MGSCTLSPFSWEESFDLVLLTHTFIFILMSVTGKGEMRRGFCLSEGLGSTRLSFHCVLHSLLGPELPQASSYVSPCLVSFFSGICDWPVLGPGWDVSPIGSSICMLRSQPVHCLGVCRTFEEVGPPWRKWVTGEVLEVL